MRGDVSRLAHVKAQIGEAASGIEGLQRLILEAAQPSIPTLPEAITWALAVTEPVARRKSIEVVVPARLEELPALPVAEGVSVALGELLLTVCAGSARGARCVVEGRASHAGEAVLRVEWSDESDDHTERYEAVRQLMSGAIGGAGGCTVERRGAQRQLTLNFVGVE
jgi:hypothetical protein